LSAVIAAVAAAIPEAATGTTTATILICNCKMMLTLQIMLGGGQYFINKIGGHYFIYKGVTIL
jgi:hypothetical protein